MTSTSSPKMRGRGADPAHTRVVLAQAAAQLITEQGWASTTLVQVAERAGLTTGAIYSAFGSRVALLTAALLRLRDEAALLLDTDQQVEAAVRAMAGAHVRVGTAPHAQHVLLADFTLVQLAAEDPEAWQALTRATAQARRRVADALEVFRSRDGESFGPPTDVAAGLLLALLQGVAIRAVTDPQSGPPDVATVTAAALALLRR